MRKGLFNVEYADVFGIPFDFTAKPVIAPPQPPRETVQVKAIRPERDALEIRFPRVEGYRVELPEERLTADFNADSILELTPDLVGPSITRNSGIIGEGVDMNLEHLATCGHHALFHVTQRLLYTKWRDPGEEPKLHLFGQLKRITKQWLDTCLVCKGGTYPAQLMYQELADMACNRITAGITRAFEGKRPIKALLDPYNPAGSTAYVRFNTSTRRPLGHQIRGAATSIGSCSTATGRPSSAASPNRIRSVRAYVKNHNLGLEVPYRYGSEMRKYLPDFIVLVDDGHGPETSCILSSRSKATAARTPRRRSPRWKPTGCPASTTSSTYGRWAFAEFTEVYEIEADFNAKVESEFDKMISTYRTGD